MNKITLNESPKPKNGLDMGQFFELDGEVFILSGKIDGYYLFCLNDGQPWTIESETIEGAFGASVKAFTRITSPFTVEPEA